MNHEQRLIALIESDHRIMELLRAVRSIGLGEWCIAAGTIRNKVWDDLHSYAQPTLPSDIDVLFFDAERTSSDYEAEIEARLSLLVPNVRWEAVNQAAIHSYTGDVDPYGSIEEAMSRWADLVTAVGARLGDDDQVRIVAPDGLEDLFALRVRPNLVTPTAAAVYQDRMANKGWKERWPMLTIEGLH